jgi:hypothetical protein
MRCVVCDVPNAVWRCNAVPSCGDTAYCSDECSDTHWAGVDNHHLDHVAGKRSVDEENAVSIFLVDPRVAEMLPLIADPFDNAALRKAYLIFKKLPNWGIMEEHCKHLPELKEFVTHYNDQGVWSNLFFELHPHEVIPAYHPNSMAYVMAYELVHRGHPPFYGAAVGKPLRFDRAIVTIGYIGNSKFTFILTNAGGGGDDDDMIRLHFDLAMTSVFAACAGEIASFDSQPGVMYIASLHILNDVESWTKIMHYMWLTGGMRWDIGFVRNK